MEGQQNRPNDKERRHVECPTGHVLWHRLNDSQKSAVNTLCGYGYELTFVRIVECENLAILLLNGNPATVDADGEINTSPIINIRR